MIDNFREGLLELKDSPDLLAYMKEGFSLLSEMYSPEDIKDIFRKNPMANMASLALNAQRIEELSFLESWGVVLDISELRRERDGISEYSYWDYPYLSIEVYIESILGEQSKIKERPYILASSAFHDIVEKSSIERAVRLTSNLEDILPLEEMMNIKMAKLQKNYTPQIRRRGYPHEYPDNVLNYFSAYYEKKKLGNNLSAGKASAPHKI